MSAFTAMLSGAAGPQSMASGDFTSIATNNAADGVYTLNGSPCAITDIIDMANPNTDFDPVVDIDAGGIKARSGEFGYSGRGLEMKDPLLASLLTGFTLLLEGYYAAAAPDGQLQVTPHDADYNINTYAAALLANTDLYAIDGSEYYNTTDYLVTPSSINKIAFTLTPDRMAVSINGGAVHAIEAGCLDGVSNINIGTGGGPDSRLRSFAFYDVFDDADLPSLSAL